MIDITRIKIHSDMEGCCMCDPMMLSPWKTEAVYSFHNETSGTDEEDETPLTEIILCPYHEYELMEKMFNNWEKRLKRDGKGNPPARTIRRKEYEDEGGDEADNANP